MHEIHYRSKDVAPAGVERIVNERPVEQVAVRVDAVKGDAVAQMADPELRHQLDVTCVAVVVPRLLQLVHPNPTRDDRCAAFDASRRDEAVVELERGLRGGRLHNGAHGTGCGSLSGPSTRAMPSSRMSSSSHMVRTPPTS
jgi:hypothetical protein